MTKIIDLLACDFSAPVEENAGIDDRRPEIPRTELTQYVATDRIKAEYERLFAAIAAAAKGPSEKVGIRISGPFGSGKTSFARILGHVLSSRDAAGALFLEHLESSRAAADVQFLNRTVPYETFPVDMKRSTGAGSTPMLCRAMLRSLDYAEDLDIHELELQLESKGLLEAFQTLCRDECGEDWGQVRGGAQAHSRISAMLHRFDPWTYPSTDLWLDQTKARPAAHMSLADLVRKCFDLCAIRGQGKSFIFLLDDADDLDAEYLYDFVAEVGRESLERIAEGKIPGPSWIVVATRRPGGANDRERLFPTRIDLSDAGIHEVAVRRVLRKKADRESILQKLFHDCGATLNRNVRLEGCPFQTDFNEELFLRHYPYLPHLIHFSMDILAGIERQPDAAKYLDSHNRTLVKQVFEMLSSKQTGVAQMPVGALVSFDRIYGLVDGNIPWEKRKLVLDIRQRFDDHPDYPGMATRVARALCLMELVGASLPRTSGNIAALLIQRISEEPPIAAVNEILERLEAARLVRRAEGGWTLYDFGELRRAAAALNWLGDAVGAVNPRGSGRLNDLAQFGKKTMARLLSWYTRPVREFNASVALSMGEVVNALDHLSMNALALEHRSMDVPGLERRDISAERPPQLLDHLSRNMAGMERLSIDTAALEERIESMQREIHALREQVKQLTGPPPAVAGQRAPRSVAVRKFDRTVYILGLFGTGRRYINDLIVANVGDRARYFRDTIRLHPGPTPMIYSGHVTVKYLCRAQETPAVMSRIQEAVCAGFADSIFIYRHPLDSLLTNWVWWRTYIRENRSISGLSQVYKDTGELCADLDENFFDFKAFADGDPDFFAGLPGPGFLSFAQFVEETELHIGSARLALRLEDFLGDPGAQYSRMAAVIGAEVDPTPFRAAPPQTKPYKHLEVVEKVPRLTRFIAGLDEHTRARIETIGYQMP